MPNPRGQFTSADINSGAGQGQYSASDISHIVEAPPREPFSGFHLSDSDVKDGVLHGARRGSSGVGAESARLAVGNAAVPGVHVYRDGAIAHPSLARRKHMHQVSGDKALADIDSNPVWHEAVAQGFEGHKANGLGEHEAYAAALNDGEHALKAAGYDGFYSERQRNNVLLFGNQLTASADPSRGGKPRSESRPQ